jgi:hypothetical protein
MRFAAPEQLPLDCRPSAALLKIKEIHLACSATQSIMTFLVKCLHSVNNDFPQGVREVFWGTPAAETDPRRRPTATATPAAAMMRFCALLTAISAVGADEGVTGPTCGPETPSINE